MNMAVPRAAARIRVDDLAVFGGRPLFTEPKPIGQLHTPDVEAFLRLIRPVVESGQFSAGHLVAQLEQRLAAFHGVHHVVAVTNAAFALTMLLQHFDRGRGGDAILPAFSYRGLPHFARIAGLKPRFCDVSEATHALDPAAVRRALRAETSVILAVCNYNTAGDVDGLCAVADAAGVPILFDSVYALGASYRGQRLGSFGTAEVYSLHATKLLNGFEGGYVTTNDSDLAESLRAQREGRATGSVLPMGATLSEPHAAMALLSLEAFDDIVAGNRRRHLAYEAMCRNLPGLRLLPVDASSNCSLAVAEVSAAWPLTRDETVAVLRAEGAGISAYYSPSLHRSEHCPPGYAVEPLPVSEALSKRYLQLPVGDLVAPADVERIHELLAFVARHGDVIAARLRQEGR
jgi:dTDP-4-amino-4,6-dideoxyglucose